jgi:hypothetical protein
MSELAAEQLEAELRRRLSGLSRDRLEELAKQTRDERSTSLLDGPQDEDQLHAWILETLKVDIPRVAVCNGHTSPFEFLCDLYFERTTSALAIANRGGSKTFLCALWHLLNSEFKPNTESCTVGAIENQARRCYIHMGKLLDMTGTVDPRNRTSTETKWPNGSRVEILPGTVNSVNGPHPQKVHADEVELMDPEVFSESRNMSASVTLPGGKVIKAQDVITSTRKRVRGPVQQLVDQINEAKEQGASPPHDLYVWCIFEVAQNMPNCSAADPNVTNPCGCRDIINGTWEDGSVRRMEDVCAGRLSRSSGWIPYDDVVKRFRELPRRVWEAQQECKRPLATGLVCPQFSTEKHGIRAYDLDPDEGNIYMALDWGGTNPHAVNWYQLLEVDKECEGAHGAPVTVTAGSLVCFEEIYRADIGVQALKKLVIKKEGELGRKCPGFKVTGRFADPQGKAAILDFRDAPNPLNVLFRGKRDVKFQVNLLNSRLDGEQDEQTGRVNQKLFVDLDRCPMWVEEIENYHYPDKRAGVIDDPEIPVDDFDHCMSALRYLLTNLQHIEFSKSRATSYAPRTSDRGRTIPAAGGKAKLRDSWRTRLGALPDRR